MIMAFLTRRRFWHGARDKTGRGCIVIIFVGGLIGAGKSTIAKGLAEQLALPYCDVDEIKKRIYRKDPDFDKNVREGIPFSDEIRFEVFDEVCNVLESLIEEQPHVVVDETLHKRENPPRSVRSCAPNLGWVYRHLGTCRGRTHPGTSWIAETGGTLAR